jgi:hypothetical protein
MKRTNVSIARQHWHDDPPRWVLVLAEQCDLSSQVKVGEDIRYSGTVINQVLNNRYTGSLSKVESAVRGAYLNLKVNCPVLGEIGLHDCLRHQRAKFQATNSTRVRLYKACRGIRMPRCKHSKIGGGS